MHVLTQYYYGFCDVKLVHPLPIYQYKASITIATSYSTWGPHAPHLLSGKFLLQPNLISLLWYAMVIYVRPMH